MVDTQRDLICYILGGSIILGGHNVWVNIKNYRIGKEREKLINLVQVFASVFQLINQCFFIVELSMPANLIFGGDCSMLSNVEGFVYFAFQIATTMVIIIRGTRLIRNEKMKLIFRGLSVLILAASILCNLMSNILRFVFVTESGFCATWYQRDWNVTAKILLFFVYLLIMVAFTIPAMKHARNTTVSPIKQIMIDASSKIILAVFLYLICFILAFARVWGMFFYVEFTIENYAAILASTLCFEIKQEVSKKSESTQQSEITKKGQAPPKGTTANFLASSALND